jgi:hypothetical protein
MCLSLHKASQLLPASCDPVILLHGYKENGAQMHHCCSRYRLRMLHSIIPSSDNCSHSVLCLSAPCSPCLQLVTRPGRSTWSQMIQLDFPSQRAGIRTERCWLVCEVCWQWCELAAETVVEQRGCLKLASKFSNRLSERMKYRAEMKQKDVTEIETKTETLP